MKWNTKVLCIFSTKKMAHNLAYLILYLETNHGIIILSIKPNNMTSARPITVETCAEREHRQDIGQDRLVSCELWWVLKLIYQHKGKDHKKIFHDAAEQIYDGSPWFWFTDKWGVSIQKVNYTFKIIVTCVDKRHTPNTSVVDVANFGLLVQKEQSH
jgi:hypothetical protein